MVVVTPDEIEEALVTLSIQSIILELASLITLNPNLTFTIIILAACLHSRTTPLATLHTLSEVN
jgi:hypothetical protein